MSTILGLVLGAALALAGCGQDPPRFGEVHLSQAAPRAILSGQTSGQSPALELAPGCAGVVDLARADHRIIIEDQLKLGVSATSTGGPIGLVIEHEGDFYCDSDANTGHLPHLQITEPGVYGIRIAALAPGEPLPYRLVLAPDGKDDHAPARTAPDLVAVSVTSEPVGATVSTEGGQVLGTTPALFEMPPTADGALTFVVTAPGMDARTVTGTAIEGSVELHAALRASGPTNHALSASEAQDIRDFRTAELSVELSEECSVQDLEVDVDIQHSYVGDLVVSLQSPAGRTAQLSRNRGGTRRTLVRTWRAADTSALQPIIGTAGTGTWTLSVRDTVEVDTGTLRSFALRVTCAPAGTTAPTAGPTASATRPGPSIRDLRSPRGQNPRIARQPPSRARAGAHVLNPWGP
ncbi:MAG: proprotein convertase P-domain-containing protein [Deltaproteobacteria bacterium]|nr:proprotein convertase P-domain-containing protein [Deltaproteobacteria bacterium]